MVQRQRLLNHQGDRRPHPDGDIPDLDRTDDDNLRDGFCHRYAPFNDFPARLTLSFQHRQRLKGNGLLS